jgi:hypothetical protein
MGTGMLLMTLGDPGLCLGKETEKWKVAYG